ncbi:670_t:CDS:2, partial [Ambispora leptoticha]
SAREGISPCNRMPGNYNNYHTDLGIGPMVDRTIEQQKLEIHGNSDDILNKFLSCAQNILLPKSLYDKKLKAIWHDFADFCRAHNLTPLPSLPNR